MSSTPDINPTEEEWQALRKGIMEWWEPSDYSFPWRKAGEPEWKLLVTEVLLQRTRAHTVADLYDEFFEQFPTPESLGEASVEDVEDAIYSLGLAWRAKYIRQLGERLENMDDEVPETRDEIEDLPGVGPYVAGAFLTFHRSERVPFVDANIVRLLGRYFGFEWDGETRRKRWFLDLVEEFFDHDYQPEAFGFAVLDFTREVCSRSPEHEECPEMIRERCVCFEEEAGK